MSTSPLLPQPHALGHVFEDSTLTVFFGDARSTPEALPLSFPDYRFVTLRQTHSDLIVRSPHAEGTEADAHFTDERKIALCIRTADCIPVLIHDPSSGLIAAIHAGWRGIENEIIRKTCERLKPQGAPFQKARVWIGPHIGSESFEVGRDVGTRLEARFDAVRGYSREATSLIPHDDPEKTYVNLLAIARAQLRSCGVELERMTDLLIDTVQSDSHQSYRRDRERAGRQVSFIAKK